MRPLLKRSDAVVHLAAIVGDPAGKRDPDLTRSINVDASKRLVDEAGDAGVDHLIFVSTCSNYGVSDTDTLVTEDAELNPVSLYAETKVAVEQVPRREGNGLRYTALRLATVYGAAPRMRFDLTVNQFTIEAFTEGVLVDLRRAVLAPVRPRRRHRPGHRHGARRTPRRAASRTFNVGDSGENYTKRMMYELLKERLPELRAEWTRSTRTPAPTRSASSGSARSSASRSPSGFRTAWTRS